MIKTDTMNYVVSLVYLADGARITSNIMCKVM